jgi:hypothetical protein
MRKKKAASRKQTQQPARRSSRMALIPLNTPHIVDKYRKKLAKTRHRFEIVEEQWRHYTETERPAYERWVHLECGAVMMELRQLRQEFDFKQFLLREAEMRRYQTRQSLRDSLRDIKAEMDSESARSSEADAPPPGYDSREDSSSDNKAGFEDDDEADWSELDEFLSQLAGEEPEHPSVFLEGARLRSVYRDICRQLHPDTGAIMNERVKQLWNEVQEAYKNKDMERLETLRALCDLEGGSLNKNISCSRLMDLIQHFQNGVNSLKNMLKGARNREPGYGFLAWSSNRRARAKNLMRSALAREIEHFKIQLRVINGFIQELERVKPPAKKRVRRPQPQAVDLRQCVFDFF